MNRIYVFALLTLAAALASCGGGQGGGTDITHGTLKYGNLSSFTVTGPNLDKGITLTATGCTGVAEVLETVTAERRDFTCTPMRAGPMTVTVIGGGTVLRTISTSVPLPQMTIQTSLGDIVVEMYPGNAPLAVASVVQYVAEGFYTNLIFHRVISDFVIQGGGFTEALTQPTTRAPIKLEMPNGLSNVRGAVAMARTGVADSATSQFFINTVDNVVLDTVNGGYAVFGKVIAGMETVDAIKVVPTRTVGALDDVPLTPVFIKGVVQTQ